MIPTKTSGIIKITAVLVAALLMTGITGCDFKNENPSENTATQNIIVPTDNAGPGDNTIAPTGADQTQPGEDPTPTSAPRDLPSGLDISGEIKLAYYDMGMTEEVPAAVSAAADAFEKKYPNVKVSCENIGSGQINTAKLDEIDVLWCDPFNLRIYRDELDALLPLDTFAAQYGLNLEDVYPGALETARRNGKLYMAPINAHQTVMMYNKTLLSAAGINWDPGRAYTWEEFKNVCRQLTVVDNDGKILQSGINVALNETVWQLFMNGFGGSWINFDEHRLDLVDNENVMNGVNELLNALNEDWFYPMNWQALDYRGGVRFSFSGDGLSSFAHVGFLMPVNTVPAMDGMGSLFDGMNIEWDICPLPAMPAHNVYTDTSGFAVSNKTQNPEAAAALALFFITPEGQRALYSSAYKDVPSLISLAGESFWRPDGEDRAGKNYDAFVKYAEKTVPASVSSVVPVSSSVLSDFDFMKVIIGAADGRTDLQISLKNYQDEVNIKLEKAWPK